MGLGGGAYRYLPRTQTKPESRTVRSVSRRGHGRARGRPNRHRSTVARSLAVGKITTHPPACAPRRSCTAHRVVAARRARRRLRRSEMPPVDIAAQSRHRSAVARSLAVGQITTTRPGRSGPPACLRPAPQGPGERMRVRSTGAAAALGVAPRGAPRCCRPHQSVRSTLEPSPCRRAPLPTRTRSSAVACLAAAAVAVRASLRCRNGLWHALASAVPPLLGSVDGSYTSEHSR